MRTQTSQLVKSIQRRASSGVVVGGVLLGLAVSLVMATPEVQALPNGVEDGTATAVDDGSAQDASTDDSQLQSTKIKQVRNEVQRSVSDMRADAQDKVEKLREGKTKNAQTDAKRKVACENKQATINNKLRAFTSAADSHFSKLEAAQKKIQDLQATKSIVVVNYDELLSVADERKDAVSTKIATLKVIAVDVDCSDPETVVKLAAVRDAAKQTRSAMHEYRMALRTMVVAFAQARGDSTENDNESSGSQTDDSAGNGNSAVNDKTGGAN